MGTLIKKGDIVRILSGKDRGKSGKVLNALPSVNRVVVEGMNIKKRHQRPRKQGEKGQIIQVASPIHRSNVMLICPSCKKPQRPRHLLLKDKKARVCRKCDSEIS